MFTIRELTDGRFTVVDADGDTVAGPYLTRDRALDAVDRLDGSVLFLAVGHGEYVPDERIHGVTEVWHPDLHDSLGYDEITAADIHAAGGDAAWFDFPADAHYHYVYRITPEARMLAFRSLCEAVLQANPSGDDDLFDYWPSGVKALRAFAATFGPLTTEVVAAKVASIIAQTSFTADDLGL